MRCAYRAGVTHVTYPLRDMAVHFLKFESEGAPQLQKRNFFYYIRCALSMVRRCVIPSQCNVQLVHRLELEAKGPVARAIAHIIKRPVLDRKVLFAIGGIIVIYGLFKNETNDW